MSIQPVDAKTLNQWMHNNEAVLIDVREPAEHKATRIQSAQSRPLSRICRETLPPCGEKKLVLHCQSGKRSAVACEKILSEHPKLEIYQLEGGIAAWQNAGFPVKSSGSLFLPLDRQVQLVIGLGVLSGSVLGYYLDPLFFLLSGFFGAGLTFAALTGVCGLATLLSRMSWNQRVSNHGCDS